MLPEVGDCLTVAEWAPEVRRRISELPATKLKWCLLRLDGSWPLKN